MQVKNVIWLHTSTLCHYIVCNCIGGVIVSVLGSSAVHHEFKPRLGQIKEYKISISCFSTQQAVLRRKRKAWLARNQNNVSVWGEMSTRELLFQ
jgi:hypothetical protein